MPGDRWQQLANLRALLRVDVGPPRQEAAVHGRRDGPGAGVEPRPAASTGTCSTQPSHRGVRARCVAHAQPALPGASRRCGSATSTREGFRWIDANDTDQNVLSFLRFAADRRRTGPWPASPTCRPCPPRATASACPQGGLVEEALNTDAPRSGAAAWSTVPSRPTPSRGTAWTTSAELTLPPLAVCGSNRGPKADAGAASSQPPMTPSSGCRLEAGRTRLGARAR